MRGRQLRHRLSRGMISPHVPPPVTPAPLASTMLLPKDLPGSSTARSGAWPEGLAAPSHWVH